MCWRSFLRRFTHDIEWPSGEMAERKIPIDKPSPTDPHFSGNFIIRITFETSGAWMDGRIERHDRLLQMTINLTALENPRAVWLIVCEAESTVMKYLYAVTWCSMLFCSPLMYCFIALLLRFHFTPNLIFVYSGVMIHWDLPPIFYSFLILAILPDDN